MNLAALLARSSATEAFRRDALRWEAGAEVARIAAARPAPRVKLERVLCQLLHEHPELEIERLVIEGWSGCSDFTGTATVTTRTRTHLFEFAWDCRWRAQIEGWTDWLGEPDQIRAAREFGFRCFRAWREREATEVA